MPFTSPFFQVNKGGDCCGSRIIDHWSCMDQKVYERDKFGSFLIKDGAYQIKSIEKFTKDRIVADLKATIAASPNPCFWWVQITNGQNEKLEGALLEAGFEKVAQGLNHNTNHIIHAYLYNAHYRVDETSWQTWAKAGKSKGKKHGSSEQ